MLISTIGLASIVLRGKKEPIISPIAEGHEPSQKSILQLFVPKKDPTILKKQVQDTIGNDWKNYSVYVVDYHSDFAMGINESVVFSAASVNKIPILAALYYKAQQKQVDFDKVITMQAADVQDYGTGSMRYDPVGTTYSIKTLVRLMMQKSDNTAAYILGNYELGLDTIQTLINGWGLTQTDMVNNKTSNKDIAILMEKIYNNKIATPALTAEMLAFLKDSDFEDRIPALLPKDTIVYHKIGTGDNAVHDTGIVTHGKKSYYIGVFTSDVTDEDVAAKLLAKVSKVVFDFMD